MEIEEYLKQISEYLPLHFIDKEANEFVKYLGEAYEEYKEAYENSLVTKGIGLLVGSPILLLGSFLLQSSCDEQRIKNKGGEKHGENSTET